MWIGRWWGGFLTIGSVLFLPSLMLFCFPNQKTKENEGKREGDGKGGGDAAAAQKSRGLALVDRHMERDENGKVGSGGDGSEQLGYERVKQP